MLQLSPELKEEVKRRAHRVEIIFYQLSRQERRVLRAAIGDFEEAVRRHEWWDQLEADSIFVKYRNEMYKGVPP